jgi:rifampin ADP-ribosylating transferase
MGKNALPSRIARDRVLAKFAPVRETFSMTARAKTFAQSFFHGTKAELKTGDIIAPGYASNYGRRNTAAFVYLSATLDAAVWGAELAQGEGAGRIYVVEPTGAFEDDPDLTDQKFAGNPTKSYRSRDGLLVLGRVTDWEGHSPEQIKAMKEGIARHEQDERA